LLRVAPHVFVQICDKVGQLFAAAEKALKQHSNVNRTARRLSGQSR
jgi:hypothetical protein